MTRTLVEPTTKAPAVKSLSFLLVIAVVGGLLLALADLLAQKTLPYPWANLANSSAVWAVGAFVIGQWDRRGALRAAVAGTVLLLVAVESYYVWAFVIQHDSVANVWSPSTRVWLVLAVLAGVVFGAAGACTASPLRLVRFGAAALVGLVFLGEAARLLARSRGGEASSHDFSTGLIEIGLAALIPLVVLTVARAIRDER